MKDRGGAARSGDVLGGRGLPAELRLDPPLESARPYLESLLCVSLGSSRARRLGRGR